MARRTYVRYNPTTYISWRENLESFTAMSISLIGMVRILVDQANAAGTMTDYPVVGDIFFPSQQLYDCTNEVLDDFWPTLGRQSVAMSLTTSTLTVGTATDLYAYDNTTIMIPAYTILDTSSGGVTVDQKYWASDMTKLEQFSRNWRGATAGLPKWWIVWDAFTLRCFPTPDQTYPFILYGVPWPTEMGTGTEDISVDPIIKLSIAYRAAANVLEYTRPDTADAYHKESEELWNRYLIRLRNEQKNNLRRMKPGVGGKYTDQTMHAALGVIKIGRRQT